MPDAGALPNIGRTPEESRRHRWRLLLGEAAAAPLDTTLSQAEADMDAALAALYDAGGEEEGEQAGRRYGGLGSSAPRVAR